MFVVLHHALHMLEVRHGELSGADFRAAAQHSCDVCARAKQPREPHKECSPPRAPRVLSALHLELLEMQAPSRAGYRYVLGGVDIHSRFCFARPLKTKAGTAAAPEESIAILQRQNADGRMLQGLRTDMKTEFLNGVVEAYCKKNGVLHGKTAWYSSQPNGLGERCWRTTMDRTRAALKECGLPGRLLVGRHAALHRHHESPPACERVADAVRGLHKKAAECGEAEGVRLQSVRIYSVSLA